MTQAINSIKSFPRHQSHLPIHLNSSPHIEANKLRKVESIHGAVLTKMHGGYYEALYAEPVSNRFPQTEGRIISHEIGIRNGKVFVDVTFDNGQTVTNQNPGNLTLLLRRVD